MPPIQLSFSVQALRSSHGVLSDTGAHWQLPLESHCPMWHWSQAQLIVPTQAPLMHRSLLVQAFPSSQAVLSDTGAWVHAPLVLSHESAVHVVLSSQLEVPTQRPF